MFGRATITLGIGLHSSLASFNALYVSAQLAFCFTVALLTDAGFLKDVTGTWRASYLFSGLSILAGVVVMLLDPVAVRYEERRQQRASSTCDA